MTETITTESWRNFDDLHIDEIDQTFSNKDKWLSGGYDSFRVAIHIRNNMNAPFVVALGLSLESSSKPAPPVFDLLEDIEDILDDDSPSLYLFESSWNNWQETRNRSVSLTLRGLQIPNIEVLYYEHFNAEEVEWQRSIFLVSNP